MGVPARFTIDFKSCTNNDKDLTHDISNKKMKSQFPDYVKPFLKQYICLLGINNDFGHLLRHLDFEDVKKGSLKKREIFIDRLYNYIKKYGEAVKSGFFKDLSEEELPLDAFDNIDDIEKTIDEFLERYVETVVEYDEEFECNNCFLKINKKKYEKKVDKDYPGLRKLVDTLRIYHETNHYERIYKYNEDINRVLSLNYSDSESEDETEDGSDSDDDDYLNREQLRDYLYIKEGVVSDIEDGYGGDTDSDEYNLESDTDSD